MSGTLYGHNDWIFSNVYFSIPVWHDYYENKNKTLQKQNTFRLPKLVLLLVVAVVVVAAAAAA